MRMASTPARRSAALLLAVLAVTVVAGCGGGGATVEHASTVPATGAASTPTGPATKASTAPSPPRGPNNPAQRPDPTTALACNEVPIGHACRASTSTPSDPNESPQRNCDTNIVANANTSCDFAENAFYEVWSTHRYTEKSLSVMVHDPATGNDYELGCEHSGQLVACVSSPFAQGRYVSFPERALNVYTEADARAYASTRNVGHPGAPAAGSSEAGSSSAAPGGTPEPNGASSETSGEDEVGSYSHAGDQKFCKEHSCIGNFESEEGTVAECNDGTYSHAGHIRGACSHHGGVLKD